MRLFCTIKIINVNNKNGVMCLHIADCSVLRVLKNSKKTIFHLSFVVNLLVVNNAFPLFSFLRMNFPDSDFPRFIFKNVRFIFPFFFISAKWMCHRFGIKTIERRLRLLTRMALFSAAIVTVRSKPQVREIDTARLHLNFKLASG